MSRKRRMFDIEPPEEALETPAQDAPAPAAAPETKSALPPRRGPMAAAITENAAALSGRREAEAAIRAENDALAHEHVRLRRAGLVLTEVPLEAVRADKLARDRGPGADDDLAELMASIRAVGLSNPIRVEAAGEGVYELVQGFRRLAAYRALHEETGDPRWARIPAGVAPGGEGLETLYRRMVDENMVRKDVSFAEMADLARAYAADPATEESDPDKAVAALFASAGYQKRSYIRAFAALMGRLGAHLAHPRALARNLGLDLRRRIESEPGFLDACARALAAAPERSAEEEGEILRGLLARRDGPAGAETRTPPAAAAKRRPRGPKTTFRIARPEGEAVCVAADGRVELRAGRDFAAFERARLEEAVRAFFAALDAEDP